MDDNNRFNNWDEPDEEVGDRQHLNPDGLTDAEKGANIGGVGGAITGAAAGSVAGPVGMVAGAVLGGVAGALASGAAISAIDKIDGDSATDHAVETTVDDQLNWASPQWGDPRLDEYDLSDHPSYWDNRTDLPENRYDLDAPIEANDKYDLEPLTPYYNMNENALGNGVPGIQTGGHAKDGTPDTRGITEKTADALTGDTIDDKTGKRVS